MASPNILFVLTDQQRWDTCGIHGNPSGLTPNYDLLARCGTHLKYCFTPQPVCGPARACLQTGTYATTHGTWKNFIPLNTELPNMGTLFKQAGYDTGYIGKWHLGSTNPVPDHERGGYDYWMASNLLEFTSDAYDCRVWDSENQPVKLPGYRVDALTDVAINFLSQKRENPFFLFLSYLEPHHQNHSDSYPAPRGYEWRYRNSWIPPDLKDLGGTTERHIAGYYGMIKRLDEALGRLVDSLISMNLEEDTIILFTSDHGCHFRTRNTEYKRSCHEASIRIPAMLSGPGFTGGGERGELFSLLDLPPTLLRAADIPIPETMEGSPVQPVLTGEKEGAASVFGQTSEEGTGRFLRTPRWKYGVVAPHLTGREQPCSETYEERFLYDLEHDPYELQNLIGWPAYEAVASLLREDLSRQIQSIENSTPEIVPAPEPQGQKYDQRKPHPEEANPEGLYGPPQ